MLEVSDLHAPDGVTSLTAPDQIVAQISDLVQVEKEPEPVVAEPVEGEVTEEAPAEGETPAPDAATEAATKEKAE